MRLHLISDPASSSPRGPPRPTGRRLRVLVVDGDRPTRLAMTRLLRDRGADVRAAGTLNEARGAAEWDADAVLLELLLPDAGGRALLAEARRLAPHARLAVVTAATDPALLDAARHFRPDLLRRKPVDFEELAEFLLKPR